MTAPATGAICSREFMRARRRGRPKMCCSPGYYAEHRRHPRETMATACCAVCGAPSYRCRGPPELKEPFEPRPRGRPSTNATDADALAASVADIGGLVHHDRTLWRDGIQSRPGAAAASLRGCRPTRTFRGAMATIIAEPYGALTMRRRSASRSRSLTI